MTVHTAAYGGGPVAGDKPGCSGFIVLPLWKLWQRIVAALAA